MQAAVKHAPNVVENGDRSLRWKQRNEMFQQRDAVLLLFSGTVDVRKEEDDVVPAYQCHESGVIELDSVSLGLLLVRRLK